MGRSPFSRRALVALALSLASLVPATSRADAGHVAVVASDGSPYGRGPNGAANLPPRELAAQQFYATHGDNYDFLIVFPAFDTNLSPDLPAHALGLHTLVRNDVTGTGHPVPYDVGSAFGSASRLKGYLDIGSLIPGIPDGSLSTAMDVIAHETAHQWSAEVQFKDASGALRSDLLGQESTHWSFFLDSDASVLYGSAWEDQGNGTFVSREREKRYSDLDLYLMGFLDPTEVGPLRLLHPTPPATHSADELPPVDGTAISATLETISVQQVVSAMGPRTPGAGAAQHAFRAAFVILTGPGQQPTPEQVAFVDQARRAWANAFFYLTHGRGVMETDLVEVPPEPVATDPSVGSGLDYLLAVQQPSGLWSDELGSSVRDTEEALAALALFGSDARVPGASSSGATALGTQATASHDFAARQVLGLLSAHRPAGTLSGLGSAGDPALNPGGGIGLGTGLGSTIIDSALEGRALLAGGGPVAQVNNRVAYLLSRQAQDGGWPLTEGGPSRVLATAEVLRLLAAAPRTSAITNAAAQGLAFLQAHHQTNGFFSDEVPSPAECAEAVLALLAWSAPVDAQAAAALLAVQRPDGSWEGSAYHTALALQALRAVLAPNLSVASADLQLSATSAVEGDSVLLSAVVRNEGLGSASNVSVQAFDSNGVPFGPAQMLPQVPAGAVLPVQLALDTTGHAGSAQVFVVVDPAGTVDELRKDDNRAAASLVIQAPPSAPDLFVGAGTVSVAPASVDHLPQAITVSARVGNLGLQAVSGAVVRLELDGVSVAETTLDLGARSSQIVTLTGQAVSAQGSSLLAVVRIDPLNTISEANEANNAAQATVPVVSSADISVAGLTVSPNAVAQGTDVAIAFSVTNSGTATAQGTTQVVVLDASGAVVAQLPAAALLVSAGATVSRTATYRADVAGSLTVRAQASVAGDPTPADDVASTPLAVNPSPLVNLTVRAGDLTVSPSPPLQGAQATVTARVSNTGGSDSGPFAVDLYLGDPASGGTLLQHSTIDALAAGAQAPVSASFTLSAPDATVLVVKVDPANQQSEFDEDDNTTVLSLQPKSQPDLAVTAGDLTLDKPFPNSGQAVQVTVSVLNQGGQDAPGVPVALYLGAPEAGGTLLGSTSLASVAAGARAQATFPWNTGTTSGPQKLVAVVNDGHPITESRYDNDRAELSVLVQDGALALSAPYFSPNGDGIQDTTDLSFRLAAAAPTELWVKDPTGSRVRRLTGPNAAVGSITWDGQDEAGHVLPDATYTLELHAGQTVAGSTTAVLDTNRSQIEDAAGTALLSTNLYLPSTFGTVTVRSIQPLPDETGAAFLACKRQATGQVCNPYGLFAQRYAESDPKLLLQIDPVAQSNTSFYEAAFVLLAPDGDHALILNDHPVCSSTFSCTFTRDTLTSLSLVELASQSYATLVAPVSVSLAGAPDYLYPPVFTPDGRALVFAAKGTSGSGDRLESLDLATGGRLVIAAVPGTLREFAVSPDGARVSFVAYDSSANSEKLYVAARVAGATPAVVATGLQLEHASTGNDVAPRLHAWLPDSEHIALARDGAPSFVSDAATCAAQGWPAGCYLETGAGVQVVDLASGQVQPMYANDRLATQLDYQHALVAVDPLSGSVALAASPGETLGRDVQIIGASGTARELLRVPSQNGTPVQRLDFGPHGTALQAVFDEGQLEVATTLANLTAKLVVSRPPGTAALTLRGTATDLNFDSYVLTARPLAQASAQPSVIGRSNVPVVNGVLATWIPPAAGLYELSLQASDKAGNTLTRTTQVAWSQTPLIAEVRVDPRYFSPNGDAVKDLAEVTYSAGDAVTAEFDFNTEDGGLARRVTQTQLAAGQYTFAWDGRDENGLPVPDGRYQLIAEGTSQLVVVDTTPPAVALDLNSPDAGEYGAAMVTGTLADGQPAQAAQRVELNLTWSVSDPNLGTWVLEAKDGDQPGYSTLQRGTAAGSFTAPLPAAQARGRTLRVRADDLAGNLALGPARQPTERLFITAFGDMALLDAVAASAPALATLDIDGEPQARIDLLEQAQPLAAGASAMQAGGARQAFAVQDTLTAPLVAYSVAYTDAAGRTLVSQQVTSPMAGLVVWDATTVPAGLYQLELRATDATGRTFTAPLAPASPKPPEPTCSNSPLAPLEFRVASSAPALVGSFQVQLLTSGSVAATYSVPAGTPNIEGAFHAYPAAIDLSALTGCRYDVQFHGVDASGVTQSDGYAIDLCAIRPTGSSLSQGQVVLSLSRLTSAPLTSLDVYTRAPGQSWTLAGNAPGFSGTQGTASVPAGQFPLCTTLDLRVKAHLADGSTSDSQDAATLPSCGATPGFQSPCSEVRIAGISHDDAPAACSPIQRTWTISLQADAAGGTITNLQASAVPLLGGTSSPLAVTGFSPGASASGTATLASADYPEGTYLIAVEAVDSLGHTTSAVTPLEQAVIVDHTAPQVVLTAPAAGAVACGASLSVQSAVSDAHPELATARLYSSQGVLVAEGKKPLAASGPTSIGVPTVGLPPGAYSLVLEALDVGGGSACTAPVTITLDTGVHLSDALVAPAVFSPDGDGQLDTAQLGFGLDLAASVAASVTVDGGAPLAVASGSFGAGAGALTWNGSAAGSRLGDGDYQLDLLAADACGNTDRRSVSAHIDTTPPVARLDAPLAGEAVGASILVRGEASDAHFDHYDLALGEGSTPALFNVVATSSAPALGDLGPVSTSGLAPGTYTLRLTAYDMAGHQTSAQATVSVGPRQLIEAAQVSPGAVSPNGDGVLDRATATVTLLAPASVQVDLVDGSGALARAIAPAQALPVGPSSFQVDGTGLVDGDYRVRFTATAGVTEVAVAPLALDTSKPQVQVTSPAEGASVRGAVPVSLSIADAHLRAWTVTHFRPDGSSEALGSGSGPYSGTLTTLVGLADGAHHLVVHAEDSAGNAIDSTTHFGADGSAPAVALLSPAQGAYVSGRAGPVAVTASVSEANLAQLTLTALRGGATTPLFSGASLPAGGKLVDWDVQAFGDGLATLTLSATDRAGNTATATAPVTLDSTLPVARLDHPRSESIRTGAAFAGSATDANLASWTLSIAAGTSPAESSFVTVGTGTSPVSAGTLATVVAAPSDGVYTARLVVADRAGNTAEDRSTFTVDTQAPQAPTGLVATAAPPHAIGLSWSASPSTDAVGYVVLRATGSGALAALPGQVQGTTYTDANLADGTYRYEVEAVDAAGNVSAPTSPAQATLDATPPQAGITAPVAGAVAGGLVTVKGFAFAPDFKEYRLKAGTAADPAANPVLARSALPVQGGALGTVDATAFADGTQVALRLEAEDLSGNVATASSSFVADNQAPDAPVLLSVDAYGAGVSVAWQQSQAADVAGYLLYRNSALANAPEGADLSDLSTYLISASWTGYVDPSVADGTWTYQLQAMDRAGNLSALSSALSVTLERHAPAAVIVSPASLAHLSGPFDVTVTTADQDVAQIQLYARADSTATPQPVGAPLTRLPYVVRLDPAALGGRVVELTAVATDRNGNSDLAPAPVVVLVDRQLQAPTLQAQVNQSQVTLSWSGGSSDLAGYAVARDGSRLGAASTPTGTLSTGSVTQLDLSAPALVESVTPAITNTVDVDAFVNLDGFWARLAPTTRLTTAAPTLPISPPLLIQGVRVAIVARPNGTGSISQLQVGPVPTVAASPYQDTGVAPANHSYALTAYDPYGITATSASTPARVYAPVLEVPPTAVAAAGLHLLGHQATAGATVTISGGAASVTTTANSSGDFAADVALALGANTLSAQATDPLGNVSLSSAPVSVTYDPAPGAAPTLSLSGVSGSDVSLALALSDPSNVASIALSRGGQLIVTLPASATAYTDPGLRNGSYTYVAVAQNAHGFAGPASAPVTATVARPTPASPSALAVAAPPGGGELDLAWTAAPGSPSGYQVERAPAGTGPFTTLASGLAGTSYVDTSVANGVTSYYRVRAADAVGNLSAPTNVASGTPRDTVAPSAPVFSAPTVAGQPIPVSASAVDVLGTVSEAGLQVELFANGSSRGTVVAGGAAPVALPIATAHTPTSPVVLSPDGARAAYLYSDTSGQRSLAVEDRASHQVQSFSAATGLGGPIRFAPGSDRVALEGPNQLYVADLASGQLLVLAQDASLLPNDLAWSPDGHYLAVSASNSSGPLALIWDGSSVLSFFANRSIGPIGWVGSTLIELQSRSVVALDAPSFSARTLSSLRPSALATAGSVAVIQTGTSLLRLDPATGATTTLIADGQSKSAPALSPDGSRLAYLAQGTTLRTYDLGPGTFEPDLAVSGSSLTWAPANRAVVFTGSVSEEIGSVPQFRFAQVPLAVGSTYFTAVAIDAAGNRSPASAAIQLTRTTSAQPDLAVALTIQPAVPSPSGPATAYATVTNLGAAQAPAGAVLQATLLTSTGDLRSLPQVVLPALAAGASTVVPLPLDLGGLSGSQTLTAVVDPTAAVADANRSNNTASLTFTVSSGGEPALALVVSPTSAGPADALSATVTLTNPGPDLDASIRLSLVDAQGALAGSFGPDQVYSPLPAGAQLSLTQTLSANGLLAGSYQVVAELLSGGATLLQKTQAVTIQPDTQVTLSLATLQATFLAGSALGFDARVSNASSNVLLSGATLDLTFADASGAQVGTVLVAVPTLAPGGAASLSPTLAAPGLSPGVYTVRGAVKASGVELASASASAPVTGTSALVGTLTLAGGAGNPLRVPAGQAVQVSATVQNLGTATAHSVSVRAVVLSLSDAQVASTGDVSAGDLAPGASQALTLSVPTATLAHQVYAVALVATHDAGLTDTLATSRFQVADGQAPVVTLLNLSEGMFVRGTVLVRVRAQDDDSGTAAVRVSVDGQAPVELALTSGSALDGTWEGSVSLSSEGPHQLAVWAVDAQGNDGAASPTTVGLQRDTVAPVVSIGGVADGALLGGPVAPTVTATDEHLASLSAYLNGQPYTPGTAVAVDGDYLLSAQATDQAGNVGLAQVRFSIDTQAPVIAIGGVTDGAFVDGTVAPVVQVSDAHLASQAASLDAVPFVSGMSTSQEGPHTLVVDASDALGHTAHAEVHFAIDRTPPTITLGGFADQSVVHGPLAPTFSVNEANLLGVSATLDNLPFQSGSLVSAEGLHQLSVVATDEAGHVSLAQGRFTLDTTPPRLTWSGFAENAYLNVPSVTPVLTQDELHPRDPDASLDGVPFTPGTPVFGEGFHTVSATAIDLAGNTTAQPVVGHFTLDRTAPVITLGGFVSGSAGSSDVTPTFGVSDNLSPVTVTARLDGVDFTSGTVVHAEGKHTLHVEATDAAGNAATPADGTFTIDRTPPQVAFTGVTDGSVLNVTSLTPSATASDNLSPTSLISLHATLGGQPFTLGTVLTAEADYDLVVTATDQAGLTSPPAEARFAIDRTPPTITITGVTNGATYSQPVTPVVRVTDPHLASSTLTLDGATFTSGTLVTAAGSHTLVAGAKDQAANPNSVTVVFTITGQTGQQQVGKQLATGFGRVLALATAGKRPLGSADYARVQGFLQGALGGPGQYLSVTSDRDAFLAQLRSGQYNVALLVSLATRCGGLLGLGLHTGPVDDDHHWSGSEGGEDCCDLGEDDDASVADAISSEVTELVHLGQLGLVSVRTRPENLPAYREVLGADVQGVGHGSQLELAAPLPPLALTLGSFSTRAKLLGASAAGTYLRTHPAEVAATTYGFGRGQSVLLGFDPSSASPAADATATLRAAVAQVTPLHDALTGLSVAAVEVDLTAPGPVQDRVVETLPAPLFAVGLAPAATVSHAGQTLTWDVLLSANQTQVLRYLVQLPDQAGTFSVSTDLEQVQGGSLSPVGSYPLAIAVSGTGASLLSQAQAAANALPNHGRDASARARIISLLAGVQARHVTSRAGAEQNLGDLLSAVDQAKQLGTVSPEPMRYALDNLVRYWEARWYQL